MTQENIIGYALAEQRAFSDYPVNDVDLLVFSELVYAQFERFPEYSQAGASVKLAQLEGGGRAQALAENDCNPAGLRALLDAVAASGRFGDVCLQRFECIVDNQRVMQFGAACFALPTGQVVVAFRGTDEKLVGWHEDFNLLHLEAMPGQEEALRYLVDVAAAYPAARLLLCGHSKGGAEAEYAAVFAGGELAGRIERACSFDGMGLFKLGGQTCPDLEAFDLALLERYAAVRVPVVRYVFPSMVGLLMERRDASAVTFVKSNDPALSHNACAARVVDGRFELATPSAKAIDDARASQRIVPKLTLDERRFLADSVIAACEREGVGIELSGDGPAKIVKALLSYLLHVPWSQRLMALAVVGKLGLSR